MYNFNLYFHIEKYVCSGWCLRLSHVSVFFIPFFTRITQSVSSFPLLILCVILSIIITFVSWRQYKIELIFLIVQFEIELFTVLFKM